ncbi:MAG: hypothetical protein BWX91_01219 [Spirochaetes bacterium ADurb.Bin133]|jgi:hypothetical protein|nr:MAG: hypothetical protein BWX91_01219 [Spirochaetes bacterium ADurb.Bin133]
MIKELFQSVKSHFLKYASSLKVERHRFVKNKRNLSVFCGKEKLTHMMLRIKIDAP